MAELIKGKVKLDKDGGSGNGTVTASLNEINTGRSAKGVTFTFSAVGVESVDRTIVVKGKPETTSIQSTAAPKAGQRITLTGKSNSSALTFSLGTDNIGLTLPASYTANGLTVNNGTAIAGDPGNDAEYDYGIQFDVPANQDISSKTCQIVVTDDGGTAHTCLLTLAAGDAYLTVGEPSGQLEWDGSNTVTVSVLTNEVA